MSFPTAPELRVGLLIETSTSWARSIISGIDRYLRRNNRSWHIFIEPRGSSESLRLPEGWSCSGIIADIKDLPMAKRMHALKVPVINISQLHFNNIVFPSVTSDVEACCRLAAEYYFERGFSNLAYIQLSGNRLDAHLRSYFGHFVQQAGGHLDYLLVKKRSWGVADWNLSIQQLADWLKGLPKPVGIFSWAIGREVVQACHLAGLKMPEEVALLLLSHDEIFSELSHVPISGIIHPCEQIGHQAAAMLDELMAADSRTKKTEKSRSVPQLLLDPVGIKTRQSSDVLAVSDTVLQKAIAYIRAHPESPLQVNHVASHVGISRRALEQKFSRYLNGTPAEYIRSAHLQKAKELLRETSLTIPEVAAQTGFTSPEYFSQYFKIQMGTTPLRYRKRQAAR